MGLATRNRGASEAMMMGDAHVILVTSIRVFITTTTMISSTYIFSIFVLLRWSSKYSILGIVIDTNDFLLFAGVSEGRSVVEIGWGHGVLGLVVLQCMR